MRGRITSSLLAGMMATLTAGGCAPAIYVDVPAFRGRVIDTENRPVGGGIVEVRDDLDGRQVAVTQSRLNGTFSRRGGTQLFIYIAGMDFARRRYSVSAIAGARRSPPTELLGGEVDVWIIGSQKSKDLGNLRLP